MVAKEGEKKEALLGITHQLQELLGDIVRIVFPAPDDLFSRGNYLLSLESVKAVREIHAPVDLEIVVHNTALASHPELINISPQQEGWIVRIRFLEIQCKITKTLGISEVVGKMHEERRA